MAERRFPVMSRLLSARRARREPPPDQAHSAEARVPDTGAQAFEPMGAINVDPTASSPAGTVKLRVVRPFGKDEHVEITAKSPGVPKLACIDGAAVREPSTDLSDVIKVGGLAPSEVLARIRNWSLANGAAVTGWLSRARRHCGEEPRLLIHDETDANIPWELLWLPDDPDRRQGAYVGCSFVTARWTPLQVTRREQRNHPYSTLRCRGEVLAYVGEDMAEADLSMIDGYGARTVASARLLFKELADPGRPLSLVYIGAHGRFSTRSFEFTVAEVALGRIFAETFPRIDDAAPLVFLNACHSGRVIIDESDTSLPSSFAEVFLRSGAAGFIGTTGAVREREARQVAKGILNALARQPGKPVATALRDFRRQVVAEHSRQTWSADRGDEESRALPLLYTFMYVYYGSLWTTVELSGRGVGE
ncbi:CHAT domain-containing protein [Stackebrandtia nassauensis]|uniref:CHAT domain-containing protein n=1 Tax=Stackebrandtia nassauensis (strain DSM 44728 / CIP 108903 / NRRL B-16338 / NBRC 102104 / LLR-40K-21) TaxID=446470 RepID=D3PWN0_STANL|nr:CHAT domain-containing protein [Stackebrandtia nassauensis]ADD43252.1 hypothetical protein Snas_3592 [Stackebrandtia nassauensis DSM 44728]